MFGESRWSDLHIAHPFRAGNPKVNMSDDLLLKMVILQVGVSRDGYVSAQDLIESDEVASFYRCKLSGTADIFDYSSQCMVEALH